MSFIYAKLGDDGGPEDDGVVSDLVQRGDIWYRSFEAGTWALFLKNTDNELADVFFPEEVSIISIGALAAEVKIMEGYIDDVFLVGMKKSDEPEGMLVVGRNYAQDLVSLFHTKSYSDGLTKIDAMIKDLLGAGEADSEITFTGDRNPIHFQQGDYEALVIPPVEKEEDGNEQLNTDEKE